MNDFIAFLYLAILVLSIVAGWKIFTKAGQPGWASIIPIYNLIVVLRIAGRPWWWIFGFLVPILGLILGLVVALDVAKSFGRGGGFGVGLWILPFIFGLILAFGADTYRGPGGGAAPAADPNAAW